MPGNRHRIRDCIRIGTFLSLYGMVKYIPSPLGDILRFLCLKPFVKRIHSMWIRDGVTIVFPEGVTIGRKVSINHWVLIDGCGGVEIGDYCRIAHGCSLISEDHGFENCDIPIRDQPRIVGKITLGRDVWLGAGVIVLKGVAIGEGSVIGAGSVVTKDIPAYSVAVGVPAKVIRKRGSPRSGGPYAVSECLS